MLSLSSGVRGAGAPDSTLSSGTVERVVVLAGDSTMRNAFDAWNCSATGSGLRFHYHRQLSHAFAPLEGSYARQPDAVVGPNGTALQCRPADRERCVWDTGLSSGPAEVWCCNALQEYLDELPPDVKAGVAAVVVGFGAHYFLLGYDGPGMPFAPFVSLPARLPCAPTPR